LKLIWSNSFKDFYTRKLVELNIIQDKDLTFYFFTGDFSIKVSSFTSFIQSFACITTHSSSINYVYVSRGFD